MTIIANFIFMAIAIGISVAILPGVEVGVWSALGAAVVLGIVSTFIRPILLFLTLPINVLTLGLFTWVVNALLILLVAAIVPGFRVKGFGWALIFSIVLTIIIGILKAIF
ncbi:MAG: hypothetical protein A3C71_01875 [Candidatus Yanofskybacteria bacterium RIFCSPHIGHO2_02_FULL_43_15c]|uniref:Phage holin family protein n=1 Tax=Candidatus Yanofskybacteria bacterium RIFCSPHIGHO2_02_FULL_43_15c TaxID=1802679 RepID=A0A1F8FJH2_9BACT|nr:MAG: hypothetical protein A3C71_01875 [Candidatus Yanofskybacteria bacterium RIFCSPHIGHO2_02_FULL_43_15c]